MERRLSTGKIFLIILAVVLVGVFGFLLYNESKFQHLQATDFDNSQSEARKEQNKYNSLITQHADAVQQSLDDDIQGIVLYGDQSLGSGKLSYYLKDTFETNLFQKINDKLKKTPSIIGHQIALPMADLEIQSETFQDSLTRLGATPLVIAKDCIIPADVTEAPISLKTIMGTVPNLVTQSNSDFADISIDGIDGKLKITVEDNKKVYYFLRNSAGTEKKIVSGTRVIPAISETYKNYTPVIFFEQKAPVNQYLACVKSLLKHQEAHNGQYIVIACTAANSKMDTTLTEEFGYNYIRLDDSENTEFPDIADKIYTRMKTLHYLDNILDTVQKAEEAISNDYTHDLKH